MIVWLINFLFIAAVLFVVNTLNFPSVLIMLIAPGIGVLCRWLRFVCPPFITTKKKTHNTVQQNHCLHQEAPVLLTHKQEWAAVKLGRIHVDMDGSQFVSAFMIIQLQSLMICHVDILKTLFCVLSSY